jgi:hypothetical protein
LVSLKEQPHSGVFGEGFVAIHPQELACHAEVDT